MALAFGSLAGEVIRHVGASGVIYGMAAFLFASGMLRGQRTLMALSLLVVFLYGKLGMIFPAHEDMSWEGHLCGAFIGLALAFLHRRVPPAVSDPAPGLLLDEEDEEPPAPYLEDDAGDVVDEHELAWKRKLAERAEQAKQCRATWDN